MDLSDAFGTYHPAINFALFACAIAFGMCLRHPAFLAASACLAALYYLTVKGFAGWKTVVVMIPVFAVLSLVNPLFNTLGDTVLFTYLHDRPYTLEALYYGMSTAAMFAAIMLWFAAYNVVMTSDKFTYLFGGIVPAISLVLTMVLRLVPNYQHKVLQLSTARTGIGKSLENGGGMREKVEHGTMLLSILTTWALEHGVTVADSMRSRGFGLPRRTTYSLYRFDMRDRLLLAGMAVLVAATLICVAFGAASVEYVPSVIIPAPSPVFVAGFVSYALFLSVPSIVNIREYILWHISLSSI